MLSIVPINLSLVVRGFGLKPFMMLMSSVSQNLLISPHFYNRYSTGLDIITASPKTLRVGYQPGLLVLSGGLIG